MNPLVTATDRVSKDERAKWLIETNVDIPGRGSLRVQRIQVLREPFGLAIYEVILGPSGLWKMGPFQIPSGIGDDPPYHWAYSVGEIREQADFLREGRVPDDGALPDPHMVQGWLEQLDQLENWKKMRSQFGAAYKVQRD